MSLVIVRRCSLLLLLCDRNLTTFSKDDNRCVCDVFSKSRKVLILLFRLNIAEATNMYIHTILLCLFWFIWLTNKMVCISENQLIKITGLSNSAEKKPTASGSFYKFLMVGLPTFFLKRYLGESVFMCCLCKTFCSRFKERTQIQQESTQCQLLVAAFLALDERFDEGLFLPNRNIGQIWITHPKLSYQPCLRF